MGLSITRHDLWGNSRVAVGSHVFSASYTTGGEACDFGMRVLEQVHIDQGVGGYVCQYDYTNKKVKAYYGDNNNTVDGPLIEVPATTDLSAVTVKMTALGQ